MNKTRCLLLPALATMLVTSMAVAQPSPVKILKATSQNIQWGHYDADAKPAIVIKSGETIRVDTVSGTPDRLVSAGAPDDDVMKELRAARADTKDRGPGGHLLTGPIGVEGAEPGDVLQIDILEIIPRVPYGYNNFGPNSGILLDEFPYSHTKVIKLDMATMTCEFAPGIHFPAKPFFGSMGVAPVSGRVNSAPPGYYAGNMDNKELVAGTTLYIPISRPLALLNVGDGHLAMGDGEVDVTAVESSLTGVLRLTVRKDMHLLYPRAETPTHIIAMGFHEDLNEAARRATREMLDYLVTNKGLSRDDAYALMSVAIDMHVTQVVDGVKGVHMMMAKSLFTK